MIKEFTRSSVCMGDDCNAPHYSKENLSDNCTEAELKRVLAGYLPYAGRRLWRLRVDNELIATFFIDDDRRITEWKLDAAWREKLKKGKECHCS